MKFWLGYYSKKRIVQQWLQLSLLGETDAHKILEVGPALGGVTALLVNGGCDVTTLDILPKDFVYPDVPHIQEDLRLLDPNNIKGFDAIICCETLEHIDWNDVPSVLNKFKESGARYLILSVPYMGFQFTLDVYFNRHTFKEYFSMKKFRHLKNFKTEPAPGHQWEVGYKGYGVEDWEKVLKGSGWNIKTRDFSEKTRSIFHLLEVNKSSS